jgi:hypothetical protein
VKTRNLNENIGPWQINLPIRPVVIRFSTYDRVSFNARRDLDMGEVGYGGAWTSTGAILVLFILLVIITKSFLI